MSSSVPWLIKPVFDGLMLRMIMKTPDQGGDTLVAAALDPTLEDSKVKQMIFGLDALPLCSNQEFIH